MLDRGADVNAAATLSEAGVGGQTPIFHAGTQRDDAGLPIVGLLLKRGADLSLRTKLPGHYERPDEIVECTPLRYALLPFRAEEQMPYKPRPHEATLQPRTAPVQLGLLPERELSRRTTQIDFFDRVAIGIDSRSLELLIALFYLDRNTD